MGGHEGPPYPPTLGSAPGNPGRSSMARSPTLGRALREPRALLDGALPHAREGPEGTRGRSSMARSPTVGKRPGEPGALLDDARPLAIRSACGRAAPGERTLSLYGNPLPSPSVNPSPRANRGWHGLRFEREHEPLRIVRSAALGRRGPVPASSLRLR